MRLTVAMLLVLVDACSDDGAEVLRVNADLGAGDRDICLHILDVYVVAAIGASTVDSRDAVEFEEDRQSLQYSWAFAWSDVGAQEGDDGVAEFRGTGEALTEAYGQAKFIAHPDTDQVIDIPVECQHTLDAGPTMTLLGGRLARASAR
jgi:hypothetical protein